MRRRTRSSSGAHTRMHGTWGTERSSSVAPERHVLAERGHFLRHRDYGHVYSPLDWLAGRTLRRAAKFNLPYRPRKLAMAARIGAQNSMTRASIVMLATRPLAKKIDMLPCDISID